MKKLTGFGTSFVLGITAALFFLGSSPCHAEEVKLDTDKIMHDIQQMTSHDHKLVMAIWFPEEFWKASFASNAKLTPEQTDGFLKTLKPYTLILVVKGEFGSFGGMTYESGDTIRSNITLIDSKGNHYAPLDETAPSADVQNFLDMMKPMFARMLGSMGKNMNIFLFPATSKNGTPIAAASKEGQFSIQLEEDTLRWRLPLGSVLAQKTCSKCGEKLSGAFKFCPYDGTALDK